MPKKDDPLKGLWLAVLLWLFGIMIVFIVCLVVVFGTITSVRKLRK